MELEIKKHISEELNESKKLINRLVGENINNKLDAYLKQFDKKDAK
jgi:hypothetical protein